MIKKLSLVSLFTMLPASFYYAQTTVYAYVKDAQGNPVERAEVDLVQSANDVTADKIGYFQFVDLKPGTYQIVVTKQGFEQRIIDFQVASDEKRKDLGVISLLPSANTQDMGILLIDDAVADADGSSMQPTVGLLSSGRDAFQNAAAFELGAYWFRPRGIDNRFEDVLFNGVSMSKNDNGRIDFSNWAGLNDVTRYPQENADNLTPSEYTFGNLGGVVYYNTRASSFRKGASLAYSLTNRSYRNRLMGTYSSGMMANGWAFTVSGSRRWAEEGIIEGTVQNSYAYFAAVEKKFSERFSINLTAFGTPTRRGTNSPSTQEAYDILGKNYNSFWGWQDGVKRNSRMRRTFEPVFMLQTFNKLGKNSNWNNTISYQTGEDARSRLDWFHAQDPHPTYYRRLPSYGISSRDEFIANSQINWESLYLANFNNREEGARYSLVEDVSRDKTFNFISHFDTKLYDNWKLNLNLAYQKLKSDNFRRIEDLLGASYANNLDAFGSDRPYNMDDPNTKVGVGDRTQYSFDLLRDHLSLHAETELDLRKWSVAASAFVAYSESQRNGHFRNHFYQDNSKGKSAVYDALEAGLKARVTYKLDGRNFVTYSGTFFSLAPTLNEIFINPRVSDFVTPGVANQIINSNELSYIHRGQILKLRLSAYWTDIDNATEITRYYGEGLQLGDNAVASNAFVTEALTGIRKRHKGLELGADLKVSPTLNIIAAGSYGEYTYENNPNLYLTLDSDLYARGFESLGQANIKGYKVAGTPQKAASLGFRYNSPKFWWFGASANYLADQFLSFSSIIRSASFYTNPLTGDPYAAYADPFSGTAIPEATPENVAALVKQTKFDDQFMINANVGKSFRFGKYRMGVSLSVNNVLNNRNYVTGGFEQGRKSNFREFYLESQRETPYFGPRLWYDRGRTYFANVYLRF
ncbi:TonB-dependent receptor [Bergeyella sp. RCAD1439]|uniref:TonB-dependent receptor n=1 Tax=Bergeyella anatis TaxID=3113737 RepID=UPI002E17725C|nr:TonB-dependent receptor [Bergeyella sp. RCAD1439]